MENLYLASHLTLYRIDRGIYMAGKLSLLLLKLSQNVQVLYKCTLLHTMT